MVTGIPLKILSFSSKKHSTKWISLNAEQKLQLWSLLNFAELFEGLVNLLIVINDILTCLLGTGLPEEIIEVWVHASYCWQQLIKYLRCLDERHESCYCQTKIQSPEDFAEVVKEFIGYLAQLHPRQDDCVTPYLHVWLCHVPYMLYQHGSLQPFSTSAQELLNSVQTLTQFRATNQHNVPVDLLKHQLMSLWFQAHPEIRVPLPRTHLSKFVVPVE